MKKITPAFLLALTFLTLFTACKKPDTNNNSGYNNK